MEQTGVLREGFHPINYGASVIKLEEERILVVHPTPKSKMVSCPISDKRSWWVVGEAIERGKGGFHYRRIQDPNSLAKRLTRESLLGRLLGVPEGTRFKPYEEVWDDYGGKRIKRNKSGLKIK